MQRARRLLDVSLATQQQASKEVSHAIQMLNAFPELNRRQVKGHSLDMMTGVIDIQAALVQLIEYIDGRGSGFIRMTPE